MVERRERVRDALDPQPGERIIDVGCGPGYSLVELAAEVGDDGRIVGVDSSADMLRVARRRCAGVANVELQEGNAAALPVADENFDAAISVQVLEYVADVTGALAEIARCLVPGGRIVVWDTDWSTVSWHSEDGRRMERVRLAWDEHLVHPSLPRTLASRMRDAGFRDVCFTGHASATSELSADTVAGPLVGLIASFVTGHAGVTRDEATAWADEQRALAADGEAFFACTQFCFTAIKA